MVINQKPFNPGPGRWAWITDILLMLSSYSVMFGALALRFECPNWLRPACLAIATLGVLATFYFVWSLKLTNPTFATITSVDDRGPDVSGYLATYLLPIAVVGAPSVMDIIAYALILSVMGLVYVRSRSIQINPTFYLLGLQLFWITTDDGFTGYLLSRKPPSVDVNHPVRVVRRGRILLRF